MKTLFALTVAVSICSCSTAVSSTFSPGMQLAEVQVAQDGGSSCGLDTPSCPPLAQFWCDAESLRQTVAVGCVSDSDCVIAEAEPNCVSFAQASPDDSSEPV